VNPAGDIVVTGGGGGLTAAETAAIVGGAGAGITTAANALANAATGATGATGQGVVNPEGEIVVTGAGGGLTAAETAAIVGGAGAGITTAALANAGGNAAPADAGPADAATAAAAAKAGLSVSDYLRLLALGIGLVGSAAGGSGNRTVPAGFGGGAQFDSPLPPANLPGGIAGGTVRTPIDMGITSPQDWYRYGYGPEQSFFQGVPQGPRNTSTAYTGYARGGFAVQGDGDGRSDSIDARLSDGEYVMDAETVALLGNGSNRAGARKLDRLRVNIRKQKGRKLAKGALSADAKAPERYLAGGLS
jgi:hypothetical protein